MAWAQRDLALWPEIARFFAANFKIDGTREVWRQIVREGFGAARG